MERIICDTYVKGEKHIWSADKDNPSNQEFNRKILAVNDMFGWLYEKGLLRDVSFEIRDYSDVTFFALDVKDLEPHREAMAASGLKNADIALQHIFEEYYTPCEYSGAIELGWTMMGYRDVDGCVGRSWECGLIKHLDSAAVHDVGRILDSEGVKAAVKAAFELSGFEPSDIAKDGSLLTVIPLSEEHRRSVEKLDEASGNKVADMLDSEGYAWGLFKDKNLIGYCTIGGADELVNNEKAQYIGCSQDSLLLSDVFVMPQHRGQGCALFLVNEAIKLRTKDDPQLVFLDLLDDDLSHLYEKIGFSLIDDSYFMVRDERAPEVKAFEQAFAHYSSIDKSMLTNRDYLFDHSDKLLECYKRGEQLDLMDVDCWVQYEKLLGENLDFDEYCAVNAVLDGDPHDIEEGSDKEISFLREALQDYRDNGPFGDPRPVLSLIEGVILHPKEKPSLDSRVQAAQNQPSTMATSMLNRSENVR